MSLEHNNKVFICFVDYEKAFDKASKYWSRLAAQEIDLESCIDCPCIMIK